MSSLSAARADNYYYPREWRPELGSINQFQGSHPLGKRAKHLASDGVLVVRFEMPFNVWCTHCETHIGRGVRFNAKKRACGKYFTTPLYEFVLTCASCSGEMVVRTDPANRTYALVSGVRKHVDTTDVADSGDSSSVLDTTERLNAPHVTQMLQTDPFYRLEHEDADKRVAQQQAQGLVALLAHSDTRTKDNYASNAALRATFRSEKQRQQRRLDRGARRGLTIPLLDVHVDDVAASKAVVFTRSSRPLLASSTAEKTTVDSFAHFGDAIGSHLHRLTAAKRKRKERQQTGTTVATTAAAGMLVQKRSSVRSSSSVEARAHKLLQR